MLTGRQLCKPKPHWLGFFSARRSGAYEQIPVARRCLYWECRRASGGGAIPVLAKYVVAYQADLRENKPNFVLVLFLSCNFLCNCLVRRAKSRTRPVGGYPSPIISLRVYSKSKSNVENYSMPSERGWL